MPCLQLFLLPFEEDLLKVGHLVVVYVPEHEDLVVEVLEPIEELAVLALLLGDVDSITNVVRQLPVGFVTVGEVRPALLLSIAILLDFLLRLFVFVL